MPAVGIVARKERITLEAMRNHLASMPSAALPFVPLKITPPLVNLNDLNAPDAPIKKDRITLGAVRDFLSANPEFVSQVVRPDVSETFSNADPKDTADAPDEVDEIRKPPVATNPSTIIESTGATSNDDSHARKAMRIS